MTYMIMIGRYLIGTTITIGMMMGSYHCPSFIMLIGLASMAVYAMM